MDAVTTTRGRLVSSAKELGLGLVVTGILVGGKMLLERSPGGHRIELFTYELLQRQLPYFTPGDRLPILVVDINKIPGGGDEPTPRGALKDLIDGIMAHQPAGIAVDIDFSPNETGWMTDDDPSFFDFCLQTAERRQRPVLLGVYRAIGEPPHTWLGLEKYKSLAAGVWVDGADTSRLPLWTQADGAERLPGLGAALAGSFRESIQTPPSWLLWALETDLDNRVSVARGITGKLRFAKTLVNYSKLEQIKHEAISTISRASVEEFRERFRGRMILLGDATEFTDPFVVAGRNAAVPGVFLQACLAYSIAVEPLHEIRLFPRLVLDFSISLLISLGAICLRLRGSKNIGNRLEKWRPRFLYIAVMLVFILGIVMIRCFAVMWLDCVLAAFALLLHPSAERRFSRLWTRTMIKGGFAEPEETSK